MSKNFGTILEEARVKQGISLREAADATKIRSDFLQAFENANGDFNMPLVYKKGFLRLYAEYLHLDADPIVDSFMKGQETTIGHLVKKFQSSKDTSGTNEVSNDSKASKLKQTTLPLASTTIKREFKTQEEDIDNDHKEPAFDLLAFINWQENKQKYIKGALVVAASLVMIIGVSILFSKFTESSNEKNFATSTQYKDINSTPEELYLISHGEVQVVVRQEENKKRLYSGTIEAGKRITLVRQGPVRIHFSSGKNLTIETASGEKVRPAREGVGWMEIQSSGNPVLAQN